MSTAASTRWVPELAVRTVDYTDGLLADLLLGVSWSDGV